VNGSRKVEVFLEKSLDFSCIVGDSSRQARTGGTETTNKIRTPKKKNAKDKFISTRHAQQIFLSFSFFHLFFGFSFYPSGGSAGKGCLSFFSNSIFGFGLVEPWRKWRCSPCLE
jgi:hypothetical protein